MSMPAGTVFHEYHDLFCRGMQIKGETCGTDFYTTQVPQVDAHNSDEETDKWDAMAERGESHPLDFDGYMREALFDESKRYAVWEQADIDALISRLRPTP